MDYSNFCQKDFQSDLLLNTGDRKNNYLKIEKNFVETLDKHALKKIKIFRGNHKPHINKKQENNRKQKIEKLL